VDSPVVGPEVDPIVLDGMRSCGFKFATTQMGSRFLQSRIDANDTRYVDVVFKVLLRHPTELMTDLFGNYLCQALVQRGSDEQINTLVRELPYLAFVSCDRQGTRAMQKLVSVLRNFEDQTAFANAMNPHVAQLAVHPNGSHVVYAVLERFPKELLSAIFDLCIKECGSLASDPHGLCILKKSMSVAPPDVLVAISEKIVDDALRLADDQYGNYILQHLLELGPTAQLKRLRSAFKGKYAELSRRKCASNVVEKSLKTSDYEWTHEIIGELLQSNVAQLLQDNYGNYVMQNALQAARGEQAAQLIAVLRPLLPSLRKNIRKKWERLLSAIPLPSKKDGGRRRNQRRKGDMDS